ncbi:MAG: alpha-amylase [Cyanobacteria bacterium P01_D01_bin.71]
MSKTNGVMMQYFHWYSSADDNLWNKVKKNANALAQAGITALWLPPAYKACNPMTPDREWDDVGYSTYDWFDLGEFHQKGKLRTRYGTKDEYLAAIQAAHAAGIEIYADVVFNHKNGGDHTEQSPAVAYYADNRQQRVMDDGGTEIITTYTRFDFPGRGDKYSSLKWNWTHFDAVNYNHDRSKEEPKKIYLFEGKSFENMVSLEHGNYDFLLGCDLDMENDDVCKELNYWGEWILNTTHIDGFRLDAIKHIPCWFFNQWLDHVRQYAGKNLFCVGEYWQNDTGILHDYITRTGGRMSLFDVALHYNFHYASTSGGAFDMRQILNGTLMAEQPALACTIVENHDSQPLQALESPVEDWFKPLAYAIILLRREGYPCVFYGDYYGATYKDCGRDGNLHRVTLASHQWIIDKLLSVRQHYAYGKQYDYFDHWDIIGWTRLGDGAAHPKAMAVLLSDGSGGSKWMEVGQPNAKFVDSTGHLPEPIYSNEWGWAEFRCGGGSVSVWVQE